MKGFHIPWISVSMGESNPAFLPLLYIIETLSVKENQQFFPFFFFFPMDKCSPSDGREGCAKSITIFLYCGALSLHNHMPSFYLFPSINYHGEIPSHFEKLNSLISYCSDMNWLFSGRITSTSSV